MPQIEIYTKSWCPYCARAKAHLDTEGHRYVEIDVTADSRREREMVERAGRTSVPQIFVNGTHVGGSDDLLEAHSNGEFEALLKREGATA